MTSLAQNSFHNFHGDCYDDGYLHIEYDNYFLTCRGQRIYLSKTEFLLFSRLTRHPNRVVSYDELWKSAWSSDKLTNTEMLKVYVYNLRRTFKPFGIKFETLVNVGYRFVPFENNLQ